MDDNEANTIAQALERMINGTPNLEIRRCLILAKIELRKAQCLALRDAAVAREAAT